MQLHKLTSTDGFIVFDLDDAPAVGIVRLAPKVLRDGAELLARSTTYAAASFGLQLRGASGAINAKPDDRDSAVAAFLAEVTELVETDRWLPGPGLGVTPDDLAPLPRAEQRAVAFDQTATGESAVAAAAGALGSLDGARVAIVGSGPVGAEAAAASASARGATAEPDAGMDAEADVLLVAGRAGALEHDLAATVKARVVVPLTPVPVTARALAVLGRGGTVVVPDFLSTAAPLLAAFAPDGGEPLERVETSVAELAGEGTDLWMAACLRAEGFLRTWQSELPFGRPLA
jgi:glutamate dehydrogenase/leucine dehydrogenase